MRRPATPPRRLRPQPEGIISAQYARQGGRSLVETRGISVPPFRCSNTKAKRVPRAREELLQFERLLAELSARFINLPAAEIDGAITDALRKIIELLGVDRGALLRYPPQTGEAYLTHSWAVEGVLRRRSAVHLAKLSLGTPTAPVRPAGRDRAARRSAPRGGGRQGDVPAPRRQIHRRHAHDHRRTGRRRADPRLRAAGAHLAGRPRRAHPRPGDDLRQRAGPQARAGIARRSDRVRAARCPRSWVHCSPARARSRTA